MNRAVAKLKLAANEKPLKERQTRLKQTARNLRAWGPAAAWAVVLFLLSAVPLTDDPSWMPINDKVAHVGLYGMLGVTLAWGRWRSSSQLPHFWLLLVGVLYGVSDEWHQSFVPGRTPSLADWGADVIGVALGYTLFWIMISIRTSGAERAAATGSRNEGE